MLIDSDGDVPGATESLGEDDEVSGAELHALGRTLHGGLYPALEKIACLLCIKFEGELSRRTTPPVYRTTTGRKRER